MNEPWKSQMTGHAIYCQMLLDGKIKNNVGGPPLPVVKKKKDNRFPSWKIRPSQKADFGSYKPVRNGTHVRA